MLYPVATSTKTRTGFLGVVRSQSDANKILKCKTRLIWFAPPKKYDTIDKAWSASEKMQTLYMDEIIRIYGEGMNEAQLNHLIGSKRPHLPVPIYYAKAGAWQLNCAFHMPAWDIPIARAIGEALHDPLGFAPRTRKKSLSFENLTAIKTVVTLSKSWAKVSTPKNLFSGLLLSRAARIIKSEDDGRYRVHLTYWKLPRKGVRRDHQRRTALPSPSFLESGQWRSHEKQDDYGSDVRIVQEEGSGIPMGK